MMNRKTFNIIIGLLMVTFLMVSGCLRSDNRPKSLDECIKIEENDNRDGCLYMLAWDKKNLSICELIKEERMRNTCAREYFARLPLQKKYFSSTCEEINNSLWKEYCYQAIKRNRAIW